MKQSLLRAVRPNHSLKRSANGRPPGPVKRYAVHFRQPGPSHPAVGVRLAPTLGSTGRGRATVHQREYQHHTGRLCQQERPTVHWPSRRTRN